MKNSHWHPQGEQPAWFAQVYPGSSTENPESQETISARKTQIVGHLIPYTLNLDT